LPLFDKGKELEAFVAAIKAGKILQDQHAYNLEVMNALQEALNQRSQRNNLEGHGGPVYSVSFSAEPQSCNNGDNSKKQKNLPKLV
jgi:uncharacterized protein YkuJ